MSEAKSFNCPKCGSPLVAQGSAKEITCQYCGSTVIVPAELVGTARLGTPQQQKRADEIMERLIVVTDPKEEERLMAELEALEEAAQDQK
ncbi:MAG: hypothetical protein P4L50_11035 [Anaerolineaceae bacterium]|nr:hypothetical protein [Anaerolineaceae bacterium]